MNIMSMVGTDQPYELVMTDTSLIASMDMSQGSYNLFAYTRFTSDTSIAKMSNLASTYHVGRTESGLYTIQSGI